MRTEVDLMNGRQSGVTARLFSVMRRRDDLPEMNIPLVILCVFLITVFSSASARLAASDHASPIFSFAGVISAMAICPMVVCLYSLIILLWRRVASLLVTPVMFTAMWVVSDSIFWALVLTMSALFTSYMFAVSMISRESRFRRTTTLALAYAVSIALTVIAAIGLTFGTFDAFSEAYMEKLPPILRSVFTGMGYNAVHDMYYEELARAIIVKTPAFIGVSSVIMAFITDYMTSLAYRILDCENIFIDVTGKITMPPSFAVIYAAVFFLTVFTSYEYNPLIYEMLSGVSLVMMLPCALIGVSGFICDMEERLYYVTRERFLTLIIIAAAAAIFGISNCITIASLMGAYFVIRERFAPKTDAG